VDPFQLTEPAHDGPLRNQSQNLDEVNLHHCEVARETYREFGPFNLFPLEVRTQEHLLANADEFMRLAAAGEVFEVGALFHRNQLSLLYYESIEGV
jgi:hypothetical protein